MDVQYASLSLDDSDTEESLKTCRLSDKFYSYEERLLPLISKSIYGP